jgi:hypothetical protein
VMERGRGDGPDVYAGSDVGFETVGSGVAFLFLFLWMF